MSGVEPAATDPPAASDQPDEIRGLTLMKDPALVPRPVDLGLPEVTGRESSWALIPHAAILARMVASTEFVPAKLRNRPAAVAALMLTGHELGLGPLTSFQALAVTDQGDIITYAKTLRALTRSHGHKIWPDPSEYSNTRVRWHGYRADDPDHVMSVVFTMDDAKQAKLVRPGGAWEKSPRAMLSARASAELCRMIDEDGLLGISITAEEAADNVPLPRAGDVTVPGGDGVEPPPDTAAPSAAAGTQRRQVRDRKSPPPAPNPELPDDAHATGSSTKAAGASPQSAPGAVEEPPPDDQIPEDPFAEPEGTLPLTPSADEIEAELSGQREGGRMPNDQMLAMLCREAGIDRSAVARIVSGGRTTSARELTRDESLAAIQHARAIGRGEERIAYAEGPDGPIDAFVAGSPNDLVNAARKALAALGGKQTGDGLSLMRSVLEAEGWTEKDGQAIEWIKGLAPEKITAVARRAREALNPEENA